MLLRQHLSLVVGSVVPEAHDHIPGTSYACNYSHQSCMMHYASNIDINVNSIKTSHYHGHVSHYYTIIIAIVCQVFT